MTLATIEAPYGPWAPAHYGQHADSGSDLPLLERCGTAVAVNPD